MNTLPTDISNVPAATVHKSPPLPAGYRQAIVTGITVVLGFSLLLLRYWSLESPGSWTVPGIIAASAVFFSITLQIYTLYRALRIEDEEKSRYHTTLGWFITSAAILIFGFGLTILVSGGAFADATPQPLNCMTPYNRGLP